MSITIFYIIPLLICFSAAIYYAFYQLKDDLRNEDDGEYTYADLIISMAVTLVPVVNLSAAALIIFILLSEVWKKLKTPIIKKEK